MSTILRDIAINYYCDPERYQFFKNCLDVVQKTAEYVIVFPIGSTLMVSSNPNFGAFVRRRRKASGLTQRALGELAGVGTRFVSELERGKTSVRLDVVNRVLATFGKTLGIVDARKGEIE